MLLIAPTEHEIQKHLKATTTPHRISSLPEQHGVDILTPSAHGLVGYQRKTIPDLKASIQDGRLYKELAQITNSSLLYRGFVIIEYNPYNITTTGAFLDATFPRQTYLSILTKFQLLSVGYYHSYSISDTINVVESSATYLSSSSAMDLRRSSPEKNQWGTNTHKDYMEYLMQSFPGVGPKVARSIVDYFGGVLPLIWVVDEDEFLNIPLVGPSLAHKLYTFFNGSNDS